MINIIVVDEEDNQVGVKPIAEVDDKGLWYRVSALWLTNSKGEILLARRAHTKKHNPGKWGPAAAGTVEGGEAYEENIKKETWEELGIADIEILKGPKTKNEGKYKHFTQWFFGVKDVPESAFKIQKEEVEEIKWFTKQELQDELEKNPEEFTPSLKENMGRLNVYQVKK